MPVSLLTLPYELREQVLTTLLSHKSNIRLQHPIESRAVFTSPITQVCKALREEAIRVFYQANAFTWTIDPEAVSTTSPSRLDLSIHLFIRTRRANISTFQDSPILTPAPRSIFPTQQRHTLPNHPTNNRLPPATNHYPPPEPNPSHPLSSTSTQLSSNYCATSA